MKISKDIIIFIIIIICAALGLFIYFQISHKDQMVPSPTSKLLKPQTASSKNQANAGTINLPPIPTLVKDAKKALSFDEKNPKSISPEVLQNSHIFFLQELYEVVLERQIHDEEMNKWMNTLTQGASREGIYSAISLGNEYAELAGKSPRSNKKTQEFSKYFLKTYVGIQIQEETLSNLTELELKEFCVKQALEIVDTYLSQKQVGQDNLYRWFAVLSSDLAKNFKIYKIKIRSTSSPKEQYDWAKSLSNDILKGELIIRLHLAFNSLF